MKTDIVKFLMWYSRRYFNILDDLLKQETEEKSNDLQNTIKKVDQLNLEIEIKDKEILKTESVLDEINHELSQIKIKILAHNDEWSS